MNVLETELPGVLVIEPDVFGDARGFFMESWNGARYAEHGIPDRFVQDNLSFSAHGVLRGLHFQNPHGPGQARLRPCGARSSTSPWISGSAPRPSAGGRASTLSAENRRQLWVPPGFAHGFVVTGESALFSYKCTDYFAPEYDGSILWNDPAIGIQWPIQNPEPLATKTAPPHR